MFAFVKCSEEYVSESGGPYSTYSSTGAVYYI